MSGQIIEHSEAARIAEEFVHAHKELSKFDNFSQTSESILRVEFTHIGALDVYVVEVYQKFWLGKQKDSTSESEKAWRIDAGGRVDLTKPKPVETEDGCRGFKVQVRATDGQILGYKCLPEDTWNTLSLL